jgi:hypothetical protein
MNPQVKPPTGPIDGKTPVARELRGKVLGFFSFGFSLLLMKEVGIKMEMGFETLFEVIGLGK